MRQTKKQKLLNALEKSHGVVTQACKTAGVSRAQYYRYLQSDDKFRDAVDDIQESAIDFVESQLFKQIQEGNITGQIFYLKTKGKNRGYIEKTQIQQETTGSISFEFN
jgi:hypothetical protein